MNLPETSGLHLDPAALNALLDQFVNSSGQASVRFVDGRFEVEAGGLALTVESVTIDASGLGVRFKLG